MSRAIRTHKRATSIGGELSPPTHSKATVAGMPNRQPTIHKHEKRSKRGLPSLSSLWGHMPQAGTPTSLNASEATLPPAPPPTASRSQKKTWRKSFEARFKATAFPDLAAGCTTNNPEFCVFAHYRHEAAIFGQCHARFDTVWETQVLAALPPLAGRTLEDVRAILENLCKPDAKNAIDFAALEQDPYAMLGPLGLNNIEADTLRLMPVLLRMVLATRRELDAKETGAKPCGKTDLHSTDFASDWRQMQLALALSMPAFIDLASVGQAVGRTGSAR